jgi:hypothetical protein
MSAGRPIVAGKTRSCPHCKATILDSASVCPACRHHLRFSPTGTPEIVPSFQALNVEGVITNRAPSEPWEYAVVVAIRNERGEEIARRVVNVGALAPRERRSFAVSVEVFAAKGG